MSGPGKFVTPDESVMTTGPNGRVVKRAPPVDLNAVCVEFHPLVCSAVNEACIDVPSVYELRVL
jgi:hypothetical protein